MNRPLRGDLVLETRRRSVSRLGVVRTAIEYADSVHVILTSGRVVERVERVGADVWASRRTPDAIDLRGAGTKTEAAQCA